ncbi:hypothetical protein ICN42_07015 [Polynucleobacter sp. 71A-WALBACH]|uniref:hypothetical protein n=1 Tax=Polynucleobacter sp. 71A-WALBACH TaxID=2689097 RepID=UPI001C0E2168|nr:hypothetical protein [Polynucleobacter sp. 71A-WALBACH]MBU3593844.1 hypothetical protein [Polynucleobacter sp. 71A-WALBACH]
MKLKTNLSQLFRQPDVKSALQYMASEKQIHMTPACSVKSKDRPFLVDRKYALQLDEII